VEVVQGGVDVSQNLLAQRWDYIFTGSAVGK
jgi:aldehyde dehydrogenase (NAD+)